MKTFAVKNHSFCLFKVITFCIPLSFVASSSNSETAMPSPCEEVIVKILGPKENLSSVIRGRINNITNIDTLVIFLEEVGGININNRDTTRKMAEILYTEMGQSGVQKMAQNLLLIHRYQAQEAVASAFILYIKEEAKNSADLLRDIPLPADIKNFIKWSSIGEGINSNRTFRKQLDMALMDHKGFESIYGEAIDQEKAGEDIIAALTNLSDPSLVGQLMERFMTADRLTKQYILDQLTQLKNLADNKYTLLLKEESNVNHGTAHSIKKLLSRSSEILQEDAYFRYTSGGASKRPLFSHNQTTKKVALRFLSRMNYDLTNNQIQFAAETLAHYSRPDSEIDRVMLELLKSGNKIKKFQQEYYTQRFAFHELFLLERNAKELSSFNLDLHYNNQMLTLEGRDLYYLRTVLEFHEKYDLKNFPALQEIALKYVRQYPEAMNELTHNWPGAVQRFKQDFGF